MEISINYLRDQDDPNSSPVKVGWALAGEKIPKVLMEPPRRVRSVPPNKNHSKSASRCPAVINLESRYFEVLAPFDIHIGFDRDKDGRPVLKWRDGDRSAIRKNSFQKNLSITAEREWRHPDRPTIQFIIPYVFFADEPVYMTQLAPFMHYSDRPWPGTIFGGRFPITNWPRPLMFAFEWHDLTKDLHIKRGEPLFYCLFEFDNPERSVQLFEAEITAEVQEYMDAISGAVNYVNQTFSLFEKAEKIRPKTLLHPKKRD